MATLGISPYLANLLLNILRNVPATVGLTTIQMHTGHPGFGSSNVGLGGVRQVATFAAPIGGHIGLTGDLPTWHVTAGETLTHVSLWDAYGGGNVLFTFALKIPRTVANGDTYILNASDIDFGPLAAA